MRIGLHSVCTVSNCCLSLYLNVGDSIKVLEKFKCGTLQLYLMDAYYHVLSL